MAWEDLLEYQREIHQLQLLEATACNCKLRLSVTSPVALCQKMLEKGSLLRG